MQIQVNETWRCEFDYFYTCLNLLGLFPLWQKQQKTTTLTNETQGFKRGQMKGHLRGQVWPPENQAPLAGGGRHPSVDSYNWGGRRHGRSLPACLGRSKQKLIWETEIYSIGILLPIQSGPIVRTNVLLWLCTCEPELVWNTAPDCSSRILWSFISLKRRKGNNQPWLERKQLWVYDGHVDRKAVATNTKGKKEGELWYSVFIYTPQSCLPISPYKSAPRHCGGLTAARAPLRSAHQTVSWIPQKLLPAPPCRASPFPPCDQLPTLATFPPRAKPLPHGSTDGGSFLPWFSVLTVDMGSGFWWASLHSTGKRTCGLLSEKTPTKGRTQRC